ncbi:MAG: hypothetical protein DME39_01975 [Verrucomicrobia bacterium]|nr:MAG: hypothetical protein DME67_01390 [Verrucomicrobiota bacterium]PYK76232.1 MAG: hypothetical protein DME39_01975 [Verrucomicrobiota bacterium]
MRTLLFVCVATSLLVVGGCKERRPGAIVRDACNLLSKEEVESVQAAHVNETKSSEHSDGVFLVSQCFYTAAEFSKSVTLALVQSDPKQGSKRSPKDFWKEKFDPYENEERKAQSGDEKEQGSAPKKIEGLGDDAYWVGNRFGGILYVLKGDAFISIGLGGTDDEETKLKKSKTLAQKALQRL